MSLGKKKITICKPAGCSFQNISNETIFHWTTGELSHSLKLTWQGSGKLTVTFLSRHPAKHLHGITTASNERLEADQSDELIMTRIWSDAVSQRSGMHLYHLPLTWAGTCRPDSPGNVVFVGFICFVNDCMNQRFLQIWRKEPLRTARSQIITAAWWVFYRLAPLFLDPAV